MDKSVKTLSLLSDAVVRINSGISAQKNQHNYLSHSGKEFSEGSKMLYFAKEKFIAENFIDGSINMLKVLLILKGIEYKEESNLHELWLSLGEEEKITIASETYKKHKEIRDYRVNLRKPSIDIVEVIDYLNEKGIENKIKIAVSSNEKNDGKSTTSPDTDFFSKLSIGLVRHFISEYLFKGELSIIQKSKSCIEIFGALRSIVDSDDEKFKKMMSRDRLYIEEPHHM